MTATAQKDPNILWFTVIDRQQYFMFTVIDTDSQTTAVFYIHDYFAYNHREKML